jgi:hypothetical protein
MSQERKSDTNSCRNQQYALVCTPTKHQVRAKEFYVSDMGWRQTILVSPTSSVGIPHAAHIADDNKAIIKDQKLPWHHKMMTTKILIQIHLVN